MKITVKWYGLQIRVSEQDKENDPVYGEWASIQYRHYTRQRHFMLSAIIISAYGLRFAIKVMGTSPLTGSQNNKVFRFQVEGNSSYWKQKNLNREDYPASVLSGAVEK